jgi:sugar phosphate isomerase/epimerase
LSGPVYVSTTSFRERDLRSIFAACTVHGIDAVELSAVDGYEPSLLDSRDRPRSLLVHNYFPPPADPFVLNLASQDSAILERSRAHCRSAIDLSATVGGPVFAAHAGFAADIAPETLGRPDLQRVLSFDASDERIYATLVESAQELARYADEHGVRFLVENHVLSASAGDAGRRLLPMTTSEELVRLAGDIDVPGFGLLVDVGHLKVSATTLGFDPNAFLDALAPWIAAFHLSDNDGTVDAHNPFGDDAWFRPRVRDMPDVVLTVELADREPEEIVAVRDIVAAWR